MWRVFSTLFFAAILIGCARKGAPQLTLEEVPEALNKAFANARSAVKKSAESTATLVAEKQYAAASLQLMALAGNHDLTGEQRAVVAGATVSVNTALQEIVAAAEAAPAPEQPGAPPKTAAPPIDKEEAAAAAAVLQNYIRTK